MAKLKLLPAGPAAEKPSGDVGACAYTPDSAFVLSGGFTGSLHLWEASRGESVTEFPVSNKPVTACTVSPDGKFLVSASLDGMVSLWDAISHRQKMTFMGSPRPISSLVYSDDGTLLASTSWDGTVNVWHSLRDRQSWRLSGHRDIVAGAGFTPDGRQILSWSYDTTVRLWDLPHGTAAQEFLGHGDRVSAGAVSPTGQWAATGARDGSVMLWDLQSGHHVSLASLASEVRGCHFLADGSLLAVDDKGRLTLHELPSLRETSELAARHPVACSAVAPNCKQLVLGGRDGLLRFVSIEGLDDVPLRVTATQVVGKTATLLQRLFGRSTPTQRFYCTCPGCRQQFDLPGGTAGLTASCSHCQQQVRVSGVTQVLRE